MERAREEEGKGRIGQGRERARDGGQGESKGGRRGRE